MIRPDYNYKPYKPRRSIPESAPPTNRASRQDSPWASFLDEVNNQIHEDRSWDDGGHVAGADNGSADGDKPNGAASAIIAPSAQSIVEERLDPEVTEPIFDPWETYVVPRFPLEVLPDTVHRYVIEQAELIGADASALAMACLAQAAGSLDHRFALRVMKHGDWWAHPRLWIVLVGDPSRKKTPVIRAGLVELEAHQTRVWDKYDRAYAEYKKAQEAWTKASGDPPPDEPERPARYVVASTTVEKLGEILGRSERGMLVKRDELSGWLGDMERYNKGSDRSFWLQAWDGGPFTVDRISRGETRIKNLSVSLIGGIQPQRLAELHGLSHTLTSDGLLQRFIPVMMGPSQFPIDAPTSEAEEGYRRLTRKWIGAEHARLILSDDALHVMTALRRHIHELEKVSSGFAAGFQGFIGKLPGMAGTLALILHLAEDPDEQRLHAVSRKTAEDVRKVVLDFVIPHAMEFYRTADSFTDGDRLKSIASWIVTADQTTITSRDLIRNVRNMRGLKLEEIHERLSPLVAGGWIEPDKPGPSNTRWHVKPTVRRQLEKRRQEEEQRKRILTELMRGPRRPQG
jgi:hypothetical protein